MLLSNFARPAIKGLLCSNFSKFMICASMLCLSMFYSSQLSAQVVITIGDIAATHQNFEENKVEIKLETPQIFELTPNPAVDQVTLLIAAPARLQAIEILNEQGEVVFYEQVSSGSVYADISPGVYTFYVHTSSGVAYEVFVVSEN